MTRVALSIALKAQTPDRTIGHHERKYKHSSEPFISIAKRSLQETMIHMYKSTLWKPKHDNGKAGCLMANIDT